MNIYKKSDIPEHLQKYFEPAEIGLEQTPEQYIVAMVEVFRCVWDVLADDGTLWLNIGDSYARTGGTDRKVSASAQVGSTRNTMEQMSDRTSKASTLGLKEKDLIGIPWMLAFALRADGWFLRQDIIWHKTNPMPESVTDRCVRSHEYLFLLSKNGRYHFDHEAIREPSDSYHRPGADRQNDFCRTTGKYTHKANPGQSMTQHRGDREHTTAQPLRNKRSVWPVSTVATRHDHLAAFPPKLIEPCILAGSRPGDLVLDPFSGSGTVAETANRLGRRLIGIELNPSFASLHEQRTAQQAISL